MASEKPASDPRQRDGEIESSAPLRASATIVSIHGGGRRQIVRAEHARRRPAREQKQAERGETDQRVVMDGRTRPGSSSAGCRPVAGRRPRREPYRSRRRRPDIAGRAARRERPRGNSAARSPASPGPATPVIGAISLKASSLSAMRFFAFVIMAKKRCERVGRFSRRKRRRRHSR